MFFSSWLQDAKWRHSVRVTAGVEEEKEETDDESADY